MQTPAGHDDTVADWLALVDGRWPWSSAASWDNVGLQVGDPAAPVERVVVTLDVTTAVVEDAATQPNTLVLAHHPLLFRPLATLTPTTASGRTVLAAARRGVAVAAAHTNLDIATDGSGTSDPVVRALGLQAVRPLTTQSGIERVKVVTFVPSSHLAAVIDASTATGAGTIGSYTHCTFSAPGVGTFRPGSGTQPHVGTPGQVESVEEQRLELVVDGARLGRVLGAIEAAHPYEQVPVDAVPLVAQRLASSGRIGRLPTPVPLAALARRLRDALPSPQLRVAGDPDRRVEVVATVGGAGDSMIADALAAGADCYVTGDLRHHVTLDAVEDGMAMIDAGHHAVEHAAMGPWMETLRSEGRRLGLTAPVVASTVDTNPWQPLPAP